MRKTNPNSKKTPIAAALSIGSLSLLLIGAPVLAAGQSSGASGYDSGMSGQSAIPSFNTLDQDADGVVSQSEAQMDPTVSQNFSIADTDQDQNLSQSEFSALEQQMQTGAAGAETLPEFSSLDLNGDGQISKDEAQTISSLNENFDSADTDADGNLNQSEFSAFEQQVATGQVGAGTTAQLPSFSELDADADGQISQSEAQASPDLSQQFSQADVDQNGNISQSEFSAFETMQGQQPPLQQEPAPGAQPPSGGAMEGGAGGAGGGM